MCGGRARHCATFEAAYLHHVLLEKLGQVLGDRLGEVLVGPICSLCDIGVNDAADPPDPSTAPNVIEQTERFGGEVRGRHGLSVRASAEVPTPAYLGSSDVATSGHNKFRRSQPTDTPSGEDLRRVGSP